MIYYISDTHFYHENVIKMCNRPYFTIDQMNNDIIEKWNNKINTDDTVYFLGDFGLKATNEQLLSILSKLNGDKHLIKGNHDKPTFILEALNTVNGFKTCSNYSVINDKGRNVVLMHYPIESWEGMYRGYYHIHGHTHNSETLKIENRFNACVDVNNFEPVTLDELMEKANAERNN